MRIIVFLSLPFILFGQQINANKNFLNAETKDTLIIKNVGFNDLYIDSLSNSRNYVAYYFEITTNESKYLFYQNSSEPEYSDTLNLILAPDDSVYLVLEGVDACTICKVGEITGFSDTLSFFSNSIDNSILSIIVDNITSIENSRRPVASFNLGYNYPNPFNPETIIPISIEKKAFVSLIIFNSLGEQVLKLVEREMGAGEYKITFDAQKYPSGIYYYQLRSGTMKSTRKMLFLK